MSNSYLYIQTFSCIYALGRAWQNYVYDKKKNIGQWAYKRVTTI